MQGQARALNDLNNAARCSYSGLNRGFMKRLALLVRKAFARRMPAPYVHCGFYAGRQEQI